METALSQKAIQEALSGNWNEALKSNFLILKENPKEVDALNRCARAHKELGQILKARQFAHKVLKIDSVNPIALKCLERWKTLKTTDKSFPSSISTESFLEEPGITKIVPLMHLGDIQVLAKLDSGDEVNFQVHPHRVSVITQDKKYIGRLPDDLSARLRKLIKLGNIYQVLVKNVEGHDVKIFIRELKTTGIPSFPIEKIEYVSFTAPELVHKEGGPLSSLEEEV
ncbi:MAG: hypothetical protein AAB535_03110 [Patescibacteria group bacterium]